MTITDRNNIKLLYHFHRYNITTIAILYGLSHTRIQEIIGEDQSVTATPDDECLLDGIDGAKIYYIDGNENNNKPQNKIILCEACMRKLSHLQMRRNHRVLKSLY